MGKAILITCSDEVARDVAQLLHATLTINGYQVEGKPEIIDWPPKPKPAPIGWGDRPEHVVDL